MKKVYFFLSLGFLILLCGCSANWHLRRAIGKDPSLLTASTVTVHDTTFLEAISGDTSFVTDTLLVKENLDSIINVVSGHLKNVLTPEALDSVLNVFKKGYLNKKTIFHDWVYEDDSIWIKLDQPNPVTLNLTYTIKPREITKTITTDCPPQIECPPRKWWERLAYYSGILFWIIIVLLIVERIVRSRLNTE